MTISRESVFAKMLLSRKVGKSSMASESGGLGNVPHYIVEPPDVRFKGHENRGGVFARFCRRMVLQRVGEWSQFICHLSVNGPGVESSFGESSGYRKNNRLPSFLTYS